jgi:Tol biopolymer transport system component
MRQQMKQVILFFLITGMTCLFIDSSVGSAANGTRETIVYSSLRPTNWDIYLFEKRGTAPRKLTDDPALDYNAVFSPDGRWVVFCSERRGNPDLYAIDLKNEGAPKLLLDSPAMEDAPAFSPDGHRLAFVSTRDGSTNLFTISFQPDKTLSSDNAVNLTRHESGNFNPAFSPDGRRIAFASDRDSANHFGPPGTRESDLYVMNTDGSNVQRLTRAKGWEVSPAWSADGKTIYFYDVENWNPLGEQ